jgi:hypothetical protein
MAIDKTHRNMIGPYSCARNGFVHNFMDILDAYENADELRERFMNGIDITDELYDRLCVHDELAAEAFITQ